MDETIHLRAAVFADIPVLVQHRRWMFEDMARLRGQTVAIAQFDAMDWAYERYLQQTLGGSLSAWVIEVDAQVVSSAALVIFEQLPSYHNLSGRLPYLHSVYTAPTFRGRGFGRQVVAETIQYCKQQGFSTLRLHASEEGRLLYMQLGFRDSNEMRLDW